MKPPIDILDLVAYKGPNILGPQPGIRLRVRCDHDYSRRIKEALKDGAQFIGMVLAYLDVETREADNGFLISASFTTPTPATGEALAAYVVEGINAQASQAAASDDTDEDDEPEPWDANAPLFELQRSHRRNALPMPALQLVAEARKRDLPVLNLPDGRVQFGYGARGWQFDPAAFRLQDDAPPPEPPWEQLGSIPIYAVTGEQQRRAIVQRVAAYFSTAGHTFRVIDDANYQATLALLADPTTHGAIIGLRTADILRHGLAFTHCQQCIITDCEGQQPAEAKTAVEWAQALGVPMLVSSHPAILNLTDLAIAGLITYAPHGVLPLASLESGLRTTPYDDV